MNCVLAPLGTVMYEKHKGASLEGDYVFYCFALLDCIGFCSKYERDSCVGAYGGFFSFYGKESESYDRKECQSQANA